MANLSPDPYTSRLRQLMAQQQISSYRALQAQAQVSATAVAHLRQGQVDRLTMGNAQRISQALHISLSELLQEFGAAHTPPSPVAGVPSAATDSASVSTPASTLVAMRQDYAQLQQQLAQQADELTHHFQRQTLARIEPWLRQWPTAAAAATANPALSATKLLPLVRPLEELLTTWDVHPMESVGAEVTYDPRLHQLYQGQVEPGELVRVRHIGYYHKNQVLHRALVSPLP